MRSRAIIIPFTYFARLLILCESFASLLHFRKVKSHIFAADDSERNSDEDYSTEMGTWNPFSLGVLKLGLTEPAWTSSLNYKKAKGIYQCAYCKTPLFSSAAKYDSGSGWPSFWKSIAADRVSLKKELGGRIECSCSNCGGHLGHVFSDGPTRGSLNQDELKTIPESDPKTGNSRMPRFCINGAAMRFEEDAE